MIHTHILNVTQELTGRETELAGRGKKREGDLPNVSTLLEC